MVTSTERREIVACWLRASIVPSPRCRRFRRDSDQIEEAGRVPHAFTRIGSIATVVRHEHERHAHALIIS